MKMCPLIDYVLRRHGIKLLRFELLKRRKVGFLALFVTLLVLGLASTEVNKTASLRLRSTTFSATNAAAWIDEESIPLEAATRPVLPTTSSVLSIRDIVLLPDDILLLIPLPEYNGKPRPSLPPKAHLTCLFDNTISTALTGLDYSRGHASVRCRQPEINITTTIIMGSVSGDVTHSNSPHSSGEVKHVLNHASLMLHGLRAVASLAPTAVPVHVKTWHSLVFEMWAAETDVVLFAKGINRRQGHNVSPDELVCVFGEDNVIAQVVKTKVSMSAQEVFRCAHPPPEHRRRLTGKAVTLRWGTKLLPTVAYYEEFSSINMLGDAETLSNITVASTPPIYSKEICACTMIFNVAKFLPEWSTFHSHVGVDRFILYDNNSEDELDEALQWLTDRHLQVSRYPWPWPKTQEAGFSHCVLTTWQTCQWLLFADVDEFVFPAAYLAPSGRATPLRQLVLEAERPPHQADKPRWQSDAVQVQPAETPHEQRKAPGQQAVHNDEARAEVASQGTGVPSLEQRQSAADIGEAASEEWSNVAPPGMEGKSRSSVGQISLKCRDFGPSNLTQHPSRGVTQGYVCRSKEEVRHKSLVRLAAVSHDLQNVVHHFNLRPEYTTVTEQPSRAVVNHYKYQAWPEFRQKFRRRVSAYVSDWKEQRNLESRDRTPGLGAHEQKPPHWETAFCEASDTALRDYCINTFAVNRSHTPTLAWQL